MGRTCRIGVGLAGQQGSELRCLRLLRVDYDFCCTATPTSVREGKGREGNGGSRVDVS